MAAPERFLIPPDDPLLERADFDLRQIQRLLRQEGEILADLALAADLDRHSWPIVQLDADEAAAIRVLRSSLGGQP